MSCRSSHASTRRSTDTSHTGSSGRRLSSRSRSAVDDDLIGNGSATGLAKIIIVLNPRAAIDTDGKRGGSALRTVLVLIGHGTIAAATQSFLFVVRRKFLVPKSVVIYIIVVIVVIIIIVIIITHQILDQSRLDVNPKHVHDRTMNDGQNTKFGNLRHFPL